MGLGLSRDDALSERKCDQRDRHAERVLPALGTLTTNHLLTFFGSSQIIFQ